MSSASHLLNILQGAFLAGLRRAVPWGSSHGSTRGGILAAAVTDVRNTLSGAKCPETHNAKRVWGFVKCGEWYSSALHAQCAASQMPQIQRALSLSPLVPGELRLLRLSSVSQGQGHRIHTQQAGSGGPPPHTASYWAGQWQLAKWIREREVYLQKLYLCANFQKTCLCIKEEVGFSRLILVQFFWLYLNHN